MNKSTKTERTNVLRKFQPKSKNLKLDLQVLIKVKQALLLELSFRIKKHITITKKNLY